MTRKSPILLQRRNFYSRMALVLIALLLLGFSLFALIVQVMPAAASSASGQGYLNDPCGKKCQTETAIASMTVTQPITVTVPITKTVPVTITVPATATKTATATATPTTGITPSTTPTPGTTPTNVLTPVGPGTPTSSSGTLQPQTTSTAQSTQTTGNGTLSGGGGDNGNTPGGSSLGVFFTTTALILGILAFLLYLIPQNGSSLSILNKILALILPTSLVRRMDDE